MLKLIGMITKARGVDGTFTVESYIADEIELGSDIPCKIGFSEIFSRDYIISHLKANGKKFTCKLKNIDSREEILQLKEMGLFVDSDQLKKKKEKDSYNTSEIIGCTAINNNNRKKLGVITDVMNLPANDIWVVKNDMNEEIYIPAIKDVIKKVSLREKKVFITPIEGLLELNK